MVFKMFRFKLVFCLEIDKLVILFCRWGKLFFYKYKVERDFNRVGYVFKFLFSFIYLVFK